ncbi:MAG: GxxExxY protein [Candidatus Magasanikbacteria bacterium]
MGKILYKDLSYEITELCFKVQKKLGRFCREIQYANEFEKMLIESKIKYKREYRLNNFKVDSPKGNIVDFLIEDKIIIDLKAKKFITKEDYNQMQRYLQSADLELGMVINFRNTYLKPKRILNSKHSGFYNSDSNNESDPNDPNNIRIIRNSDPNVTNSGHSDVDSDNSGRSKGFTLIETLIYIAIIGGVMATFISFGLGISQNRNKVYAKQEVQANARIALDIISQKIKMADGINIASSTFDADPGVLSLSMANSSLNPTVLQLNQDDGILQITQGAGDPIFITSDKVKITNLVFTNLGGENERGNIKIDMTVEYDSDGDVSFSSSQSLTTAVSLRQ